MKISVVGLGYVGSVCSAAFAKEGHHVIGVDVDSIKVNLINQGKSPIVEKGLDTLIREGVEANRLEATTDLAYAIANTDLTIIAVGTPSRKNGSLDLRYIEETAKAIGEDLKKKKGYHIVAMRSTVLPRTGQDIVIPLIEKISGKKHGKDFGYASNPEFLRESTAIEDFYHPPFTVVGANDPKVFSIFKELYSFLDAPLFETEIEVAEMIKYASNSWHATKVTFANEIGMICKELGIDSHEVMRIFCEDTKLNISSYYLKPGYAFGGSCLPKDLRAITHKAKELDVITPMMEHIMPSNEWQIRRVYRDFIQPLPSKKVAFLGLSFKADTDDLRESPQLALAEMLIGKGYELFIYDKNVSLAKKEGALKTLLEGDLHHINERLYENLEKTIQKADIIILGNNAKEFKEIPLTYTDKYIVDLVRVIDKKSDKKYQGICW
ncbi:nucleotide sugar dehydrogenase [Nitratiruptor sp. SB155-2]|uniref:nucleotide sugar dehydrogenase n=1 Tax=Nitratiruptor sp. (strain SB155-2) TaxID=387092 RepID=UPI0001586F8E|nr:UDP-glucose/GDP-mannose dehydrogenase family protein [Nitratiruptor sp. SB155-2]BAF69305.1 GDP-mannose 6-dehydrogenase [Nitratiruptor sp. SB155-2]